LEANFVITRRGFFEVSTANGAALGLLSMVQWNANANPLGLPIGSQTYPHKQRIADGDFAGLCSDMKSIGVGSLELCSPIGYKDFAKLSDGKETKKILADHGLRSISAHFGMKELRETHRQSIDWALEVGMTQMGTASLGGHLTNGVATIDAIKAAADEYNKIAEEAAKHHIQQFLHDEGFEMAKAEDGKLVYEHLFELLDPKLVKFQFQMSAMRTVGDPIKWFNGNPGRFISMHLQGVDTNAPMPAPGGGGRGAGQAGGGGRRAMGVAVGKDTLNWPKIFVAAKKGGLKNYFVEQTWELTQQSVEYLKTLRV
jgi:sugar phosphate isomerase/epimerase